MRDSSTNSSSRSTDYLERNLASLPAFRALLRAVECRLYEGITLEEPVLDLGCGDGQFAFTAFARPLAIGVDAEVSILGAALRSGGYGLVLASDAGYLPFADGSFATVIANCVLEHIPQVDRALQEATRVLRSGGSFLLTVPSEYFGPYLLGSTVFRTLKMGWLSRGYERWFNTISRHFHCDGPEAWNDRLRAAGLEVEGWRYYFSPAATRVFDLAHYASFPTLATKKLTGRWVLWPGGPGPKLWENILRPYYAEGWPPKGAYIFFACKRRPEGRSA